MHVEPIAKTLSEVQTSSADNRARWEALSRKFTNLEEEMVQDKITYVLKTARVDKMVEQSAGIIHELESTKAATGTNKNSIENLNMQADMLSRQIDDVATSGLRERDRVNCELSIRFDQLFQTQRSSFISFTENVKSFIKEPKQARVLNSLIWSVQRLIADIKLEREAHRCMHEVMLGWNMQVTQTRRRNLSAHFIVKSVLSTVRRQFAIWRHRTDVDRIVSVFEKNFGHLSVEIEKKADLINMENGMTSVRVLMESEISRVESGLKGITEKSKLWDDCIKNLATVQNKHLPDLISRQDTTSQEVENFTLKQRSLDGQLLSLESRLDKAVNSIAFCSQRLDDQSKSLKEIIRLAEKPMTQPDTPQPREVFSDMLMLWGFMKELQTDARENAVARSKNEALHETHSSQIRELRELFEAVKSTPQPLVPPPVIETKVSFDIDSRKSTPRDPPLPRPRSAVLTRTSSASSGVPAKPKAAEFKGLHIRGKVVDKTNRTQ